jgi:hypothetical protein
VILKDILTKMVQDNVPVLLNDGSKDWEVGELLTSLSELKLKSPAYLQPGLYISEINSAGYLGTVLYRLKKKV